MGGGDFGFEFGALLFEFGDTGFLLFELPGVALNEGFFFRGAFQGLHVFAEALLALGDAIVFGSDRFGLAAEPIEDGLVRENLAEGIFDGGAEAAFGGEAGDFGGNEGADGVGGSERAGFGDREGGSLPGGDRDAEAHDGASGLGGFDRVGEPVA